MDSARHDLLIKRIERGAPVPLFDGMASKTSLSLWVIAATSAMVALPTHAGFLGDEEGEWTIAPAVTSAYLFRGVQLAGASFQPAVDYTKGPLSLGLWS